MAVKISVPGRERETSRLQFNVWTISKIVLALALIGFVASQTNLRVFTSLWEHISVPWLIISMIAFYAATWAMARRYWILLGKGIPFRSFLHSVIIQTVVGNFIATSAGAVSYVALLRGKHQIEISKSVASLLLARFGDLMALLVALVFTSIILWPQIDSLHWLVVSLITIMTVGAMVLLLVLAFRGQVILGIGRVLNKLGIDGATFSGRIMRTLASFAQYDSHQVWMLFVYIFAYSFITFALMSIFSFSLIQVFAVPIGPWAVLFVLALTQTMTLIPIQVFGGLGISDVTSMYLYEQFGIGQPGIASVIIGVRLLFYMITLLMLLYLPLDNRLNHPLNT